MNQKRLVCGLILLILLLSLMIYYHVDVYNHYPDDDRYILENYEKYIGRKVALTGEVTAIDIKNRTLLVQIAQSPEDIIQASTTESLHTLQPGDSVTLYGFLTNRTHMTSEIVLKNEDWNITLLYLRSLPAIPFALFLFFRTYRFSLKKFCFERRDHHA
jgi:hypothetical protein